MTSVVANLRLGLTLVCLLGYHGVSSFTPLSSQKTRAATSSEGTALMATRRSFVEKFTGMSAAVVVGVASSVAPSEPALASGGATAGGAYLLSAKQRYNERVAKGVGGFLAIGTALEAGDIDSVRQYFTGEEVGTWKDLSAAGYLLANAFRRSSSTPPDSLPSVKKWKAFAAQVEAMTKALKKKDTKGAVLAYQDALTALDEYLEKVELPSAKELVSR